MGFFYGLGVKWCPDVKAVNMDSDIRGPREEENV